MEYCAKCNKHHFTTSGLLPPCMRLRSPRRPQSQKYNAIHKWNLRHWVKTGICESCGERKNTTWSSKEHDYVRGDRSKWQELCHMCHKHYDMEHFN